MKVFISWSADRSRAVALALRDGLQEVLEGVHFFMSERDVDPGTRWSPAIRQAIGDAASGICVVTPENQMNPWLQFEAGAMAQASVKGNLYCLLVGFEREADVEPSTLAQFQMKACERKGVWDVVVSLNRAGARPLSEGRLLARFEKYWPDIQEVLGSLGSHENEDVEEAANATKTGSSEHLGVERWKVDEILELVRSMSRRRGDDSHPHTRIVGDRDMIVPLRAMRAMERLVLDTQVDDMDKVFGDVMMDIRKSSDPWDLRDSHDPIKFDRVFGIAMCRDLFGNLSSRDGDMSLLYDQDLRLTFGNSFRLLSKAAKTAAVMAVAAQAGKSGQTSR